MNDDKSCQKAEEETLSEGARHGHAHGQIDDHFHGHYHGQICQHGEITVQGAPVPVDAAPHGHIRHTHSHNVHEHGERENQHHIHAHFRTQAQRCEEKKALAVRSHSGIAGDMLLAGLAVLSLHDLNLDKEKWGAWLQDFTAAIMPELAGCLSLDRHAVNGVYGWRAHVNLPDAHMHRNVGDIRQIITAAAIADNAKERASACFELLAACEADAHGIAVEDVHFHEVGALDSILDVLGVCELYSRLGEPPLYASPLPVADGEIHCAHGILPAPAPACLKLLRHIPLRPYPADGELLTPTGVALLRALDANFGLWPQISIDDTALVYGQREFANAPNGVIFALGRM